MLRCFLMILALLPWLPCPVVADMGTGGEAYRRHDYATALRELLPAARNGNAVAQGLVAGIYAEGLGVARDPEEGCIWAAKAAAQGDALGEYFYAFCFENGTGVARDGAKALDWYRKSAEQGLAASEAMLGLHLLAEAAPRDYPAAVAWLRKAAKQGVAAAMDGLGKAYETNRGVAADAPSAYAWYKLAVDYAIGARSKDYFRKDFERIAAAMTQSARQRGEALAASWRAELPAPAGPAAVANASPGAGPPSGKAPSGEGLKPGIDPRSLVSAVIGALDELGFDAGPPRDELDRRAHDAIRAFQRAHGLIESGRVSKKLVAALDDALRARRDAAPPGGGGQAGGARPSAIGTGFVVSAAGHVLTNNHVVAGCRELRSGDQQVATVVATDAEHDLAVLKLSAAAGAVASFRDHNDAQPGEEIVVLGYPLYGLLGSDAIVTTGTISALSGLRGNRNLIQISAPVNPGNSGGPVLDASGHIVGVVVSKLDAVGVAKVTGDIPENVNFAVNEATARAFLDAHGIQYRTAATAERLAAPEVASRSRGFTLVLECFK